MQYKPHEYQKYSIQFIVNNPVAAVFLECGLGKTSITLSAIDELMYDRFEISKVLVICPLRVANTWVDEISKWDNFKHLTYSVAIGTEEERKAALGKKQISILSIERMLTGWLRKVDIHLTMI